MIPFLLNETNKIFQADKWKLVLRLIYVKAEQQKVESRTGRREEGREMVVDCFCWFILQMPIWAPHVGDRGPSTLAVVFFTRPSA